MSQSNDPWDSISSRRPPGPAAGVPYAAPTPGPTGPNKPKWPGPAPLHGPPGWRGEMIRHYAMWGLVVSIATTVVGILCCGVLPMVGFAMTVPAFLMARQDLVSFAHEAHPDFIEELTNSRNLALAGIIVSAVGTVLGFICLGLNILFFALEMSTQQ